MEDGNFQAWNASNFLERVDSFSVNYSKGFLQADIASYFKGIEQYWSSFFKLTAHPVEDFKIQQKIGFETSLFWQSLIEIDGKYGCIGIDQRSFDVLSKSVGDPSSFQGADIVIEYLARRLASTLEKTWVEDYTTPFLFLSKRPSQEESFVSTVLITFKLSGEEVTIHFGLDSLVTDSLDSISKKQHMIKDTGSSNDLVSVSIELVENAVEPAKLIDYLRAQALIDLETDISSKVILRVDSAFWAKGSLKLCKDSYVVEIDGFNDEPKSFREGATRMRVELSRLEMSKKELSLCRNIGSKMFVDSKVGDPVFILISGEHVASATLGSIDNTFALKVLPKT